MISSKVREITAQASIEGIVGMLLVLSVGLGGISVILDGIGTVIATRWAAMHSRCIAMETPPAICGKNTKHELTTYFAFKKIQIYHRIWQGIIHTKIEAQLLNRSVIKGTFDLGPSEYKRTSL